MKKLLVLTIIGLGLTIRAQEVEPTPPATNNPTLSGGLKEIGQAFASGTNWTVVAGYGHSLTGAKSLAFADVAYNFNQNVGVILGYDYLYGGGLKQGNAVRGGVSLSAHIHPFSVVGFWTNAMLTPFVADMIAEPKAGASIGNVLVTGAKLDLFDLRNFSLGVMVAYEHRTGQGPWNANYGLAGLAFTRKW